MEHFLGKLQLSLGWRVWHGWSRWSSVWPGLLEWWSSVMKHLIREAKICMTWKIKLS